LRITSLCHVGIRPIVERPGAGLGEHDGRQAKNSRFTDAADELIRDELSEFINLINREPRRTAPTGGGMARPATCRIAPPTRRMASCMRSLLGGSPGQRSEICPHPWPCGGSSWGIALRGKGQGRRQRHDRRVAERDHLSSQTAARERPGAQTLPKAMGESGRLKGP
jgi:hypothetical protein